MGKPTRRRAKRPTQAVRTADITTFPNAVRYLLDRPNFERARAVSFDPRSFKLSRIRKLLAALGNPQDAINTVHVAGTVGKGSTVAMIGSMLRACGYAVGEFTSPHLVDVRERVIINGRPISRPDFTSILRDVAAEAEKLSSPITFFELVTAVAFMYFYEQAVDIAIIEVGLGGRLDSTNVIKPELTVITEINFDHTHILGRTLPEIAREKAGIFKPGVPALSVQQTPEVERTLRAAATKTGCPIQFINNEIEFSYRFGASTDGRPQTRVCLFTDTSRFEHVPVPLPGEHQAFNCGVALAAIDQLKTSGYELPEQKIHTGLARTVTPGRMELVWDRPRILVDGAHNPAALGALMRCVGAHVPYDSMVCVFGCCEDKDIPGMLDKLDLGGDKVIFTRARSNPRAADPEDLQRAYTERSGKMSQVAPSLGEAIAIARQAVGRDDLICITGSFYLVGEAKKYLAEREKVRETV